VIEKKESAKRVAKLTTVRSSTNAQTVDTKSGSGKLHTIFGCEPSSVETFWLHFFPPIKKSHIFI
jgi:hypothetical protein